MIKTPVFLLWLLSVHLSPASDVEMENATEVVTAAVEIPDAMIVYGDCGLVGVIQAEIFATGFDRVAHIDPEARIMAIADMSQPSNAKRLYLIDLVDRKLLLRTYVAHGQRSGELMAEHFSNENGSHQTSLGLYRVGEKITSPKHGPALLLHGLDKGINCQALPREVIMHGADYVSDDFIRAHGRLGRSWGCPAVSRTDMAQMVELLANGAFLYIHG